MQIIFTLLLYIFHIFYALAIRTRLFWKQHPSTHPKALLASRRRLPKHLAIILAVDPTVSSETAEATLTESVVNAVEWCRAVGIVKLTVYEEHDRLSKCEQKIRECLPAHTNEAESSDSETEYPLTPPPSDYSESRPLSPNYNQESLIPLTTIHFDEQVPRKENKSRQKFVKQPTQQRYRRRELTLCLVSRKSSKPAIASVTRAIACNQTHRAQKSARSRKGDAYTLTIDEVDQLLEDEDGLSSPDFMIIHSIESSRGRPTPPELHGFPPWQIRLTEIYQSVLVGRTPRTWFRESRSPLPLPLDEFNFREALDEFASAEMRFGK